MPQEEKAQNYSHFAGGKTKKRGSETSPQAQRKLSRSQSHPSPQFGAGFQNEFVKQKRPGEGRAPRELAYPYGHAYPCAL